MNSRWQQYNEQREEYVQQLLQRNVELEQAVVNRGQQLSLGQQERIDQILMDQKQKLEVAREETSAVGLMLALKYIGQFKFITIFLLPLL